MIILLIWNSKWEKATVIESRLSCQVQRFYEVLGKGLTTKKPKGTACGGVWKCCISEFWWWIHTLVKTYWTVHLKLVTVIVYKLYFNIANKNSWIESIFITYMLRSNLLIIQIILKVANKTNSLISSQKKKYMSK